MQRIFLDFEMNPIKRRDRKQVGLHQEIIEIGAARMDADYQVIDTLRVYIRPQFNEFVTSDIYRLTGITSRDVAACPLLAEGLEQFTAWCGTEFVRMYAWSESDLTQLRVECQVKGIETLLLDKTHVHWVDFQRIYCRLMGERQAVKLKYALDCCGIDPDGALHDGADDAVNSARLMAYLHSPAFAEHREALAAVRRAPEPQMGGLSGENQRKLAALLAAMEAEE